MAYVQVSQRWDLLKPKCKGCIYQGTAIPCQYILVTGKSPKSQGAHIDPEGPGGCELKTTGKKKREPKPIVISENSVFSKTRPSKLDNPEAMEAYQAGKNDSEIAVLFGVTSSAVKKWRKRKKLPTIYGAHPPVKFNHELALAMYKDGKADFEIADAIGVSRPTVCRWRKNMGFAYNKTNAAN